jgi:hypothetical protein
VRRLVTLAIVLQALAAGCANGDEPATTTRATPTPTPTATAQPTRYPVAYRLRMETALDLARTDAWRVIEREGRIVSRSESDDGYAAVVLAEWLDGQGVRLDVPRALRPVVERLAAEQELTLLVIGPEHRRHARALTRLRPTERELRSFYERFGEERSPDAGQAMLAWLRVFRRALDSADAAHVVVIPVLI